MPTSDPNHRGFAGEPDWSVAWLLNASVTELGRRWESVTDPIVAGWLKDLALASQGRRLTIAEMIRDRMTSRR